ncbi:GNAT family N-acetyltransferase [Wenzhouxiangella sp. XN79A]|uniref:GNAT family N-acetyltransferase n=1 Tax=Wenzhouxiangella sp. XN79A TaxID=2724193 RepID=UPI00144A6EB6|nr:GNAT family N-acetyltransferase [Wenzhouxiangella sp. XN79A]
MTDNARLELRPATPDDVGLLLDLIKELAIYEKEPESAKATPELLHAGLFGESPTAEAVVAEWDGEAAGFALFFHNYSTWTGKPGLYLEDLFVRESQRGRGIGKALLLELARKARDRGCGRMDWSVLDWNRPAIEFYESLGAQPQSGWTVYRLDEAALERLVG